MKIGFPTTDFRFGTENLQDVKDIRITTSFQHVFPRAISAAGPKVGRKVLDSGYFSLFFHICHHHRHHGCSPFCLSFIIAIVILSTSSPALTRYGSITTTLFISLVTLSVTVLASPSTTALEIREIKTYVTHGKNDDDDDDDRPFTSNLLNHTQQQ